MEVITISVTLFDGSRRAEVTLPSSTPVGVLMRQCAGRWSLRRSFVFRCAGSSELLLESESLRLAGVRDGGELQVFPMTEGG